MTQPSLLDALPVRQSLTERVAEYFAARPNRWIDGRELAQVGGYAGYRTRISNLRFPPFSMTIENRTRRVHGYTESCYRYVKEAA